MFSDRGVSVVQVVQARVCSRCDSRGLLYALVLVQCNGSYNGSNGYDPCIFECRLFNVV